MKFKRPSHLRMGDSSAVISGPFTELIGRLKAGTLSKEELWGELDRVARRDSAPDHAPSPRLEARRAPAPPTCREPSRPERPQPAQPSVWAAAPDDPRDHAAAYGVHVFESMRASEHMGHPARPGGMPPQPYYAAQTATELPGREAEPYEKGISRRARHDPSFPLRMDPTWQSGVSALEAELNAAELAECTFRPAINARSRLPRNMYGGRVPSRSVGSQEEVQSAAGVYERSRAWDRERQLHRSSIREEVRLAEMRECSFEPRLVSRARNAGTRPRETALLRGPRGADEPRARSASPPRDRQLGRSGSAGAVTGTRPATARAAGGHSPPKQPQSQRSSHRPSRRSLGVEARYLEPRGLRRPEPEQPAPQGQPTLFARPRSPAELSSAARKYLSTDPFERLSRGRLPFNPPLAKAATPPATSRARRLNTGTQAERSLPASAPRARDRTDRGGAAGGNDEGEGEGGLRESRLRFHQFLQRQARTLRRRELVALRLDEAARAQPLTAAQRAERAAAQAAFLARTQGSVDAFMQRQQAGLQPAQPQLSEAEKAECTFRPRIHTSARARRSRSVDELAYGDAVHRTLAQVERVQRARERERSELLGQPLSAAPLEGVEGMLKLTSDPAGFIGRMKERALLKQQLLESVREANVRRAGARGVLSRHSPRSRCAASLDTRRLAHLSASRALRLRSRARPLPPACGGRACSCAPSCRRAHSSPT